MMREITLRGQFLVNLFKGIINHRVVEMISIKTGDKENNFQFTLELNSNCFTKSLIASLKG